MYDWNGNGKYDEQDAFIDYQIYKDFSKDKNKGIPQTPRRNSNGISSFGAILSTVGGFVGTAIVASMIGIDNTPTLLILILWIVFSSILAALAETIGL
jgi:hypothetical protein